MSESAAVATDYFAALSRGDLNAAVDLIADDGAFFTPMGQVHGKDQIRAYLASFDSAFPGAQFLIDHVIESGNLVAVEGSYRGVHSGPLPTPDGAALPATGRTVTAPFVTVLEVAGGAITSHRPYWDLAGFMAQLTG